MNALGPELQWLFSMALAYTPLMLVWLIGIILALVNWRRYPLPALLVFLACMTEMISGVFWVLFNWWHLTQGKFDDSPLSLWNITRLLLCMLGASCWGMMLTAVFCWRRQVWREARSFASSAAFRSSAPPPLPDDDYPETLREKP